MKRTLNVEHTEKDFQQVEHRQSQLQLGSRQNPEGLRLGHVVLNYGLPSNHFHLGTLHKIENRWGGVILRFSVNGFHDDEGRR